MPPDDHGHMSFLYNCTHFFSLIEFPSHVSTLERSLSDILSQNTGATARAKPWHRVLTVER